MNPERQRQSLREHKIFVIMQVTIWSQICYVVVVINRQTNTICAGGLAFLTASSSILGGFTNESALEWKHDNVSHRKIIEQKTAYLVCLCLAVYMFISFSKRRRSILLLSLHWSRVSSHRLTEKDGRWGWRSSALGDQSERRCLPKEINGDRWLAETQVRLFPSSH